MIDQDISMDLESSATIAFEQPLITDSISASRPCGALFVGACSNCVWNSKGSQCSFYLGKNRGWDQKYDKAILQRGGLLAVVDGGEPVRHWPLEESKVAYSVELPEKSRAEASRASRAPELIMSSPIEQPDSHSGPATRTKLSKTKTFFSGTPSFAAKAATLLPQRQKVVRPSAYIVMVSIELTVRRSVVVLADQSQDWPQYGTDASDMYSGRNVQLRSAEQGYRSTAARTYRRLRSRGLVFILLNPAQATKSNLAGLSLFNGPLEKSNPNRHAEMKHLLDHIETVAGKGCTKIVTSASSFIVAIYDTVSNRDRNMKRIAKIDFKV
ncbi:hypothetical protein CNMCM5793_006140 [Aspergillus hiratsukae]|uniref:Uncharacterized protein n=1 Tax=Aspergillus hiratsukae TaxID=1194566 RepID=A0A8H6P020_9EURO|nr:hypothetical protein CNMCM5793_006140 [Aspergillus hiratsukae]